MPAYVVGTRNQWERKFDMAQQQRTSAPAEAVCPTCGTKMVGIVYGYPGGDLLDRSFRGEVVLGGCVVTGLDATHQCQEGHQWRWRGSRTQVDPAAAAGLVVPGGPGADDQGGQGWVAMADAWDWSDWGDDEDPDGETEGPAT